MFVNLLDAMLGSGKASGRAQCQKNKRSSTGCTDGVLRPLSLVRESARAHMQCMRSQQPR
eukprot:13322-Heterococcus_DN1.PRE.2